MGGLLCAAVSFPTISNLQLVHMFFLVVSDYSVAFLVKYPNLNQGHEHPKESLALLMMP